MIWLRLLALDPGLVNIYYDEILLPLKRDRDDNVFLDYLDGRSGDSIKIRLSTESSANRRFFHPFTLKLIVIPSG